MNKEDAAALSSTESLVLCRIISTPEAAAWREKLELQRVAAVVTKRTSTGAGLYIDFAVSSISATRLEKGAPNEFVLSATSPDKNEGADFVLHLIGGVISFLEISVAGTRLDVDEVVHWL